MVNLSASVGDWIAMNFLMWERVLVTSFFSSGFSFTMEKAVSPPRGLGTCTSESVEFFK